MGMGIEMGMGMGNGKREWKCSLTLKYRRSGFSRYLMERQIIEDLDYP